VGVLVLGSERAARAQACCAGTGVVTPGRLADHETALVGLQTRGDVLFGSYDESRHYRASPRDASDYEFGEDLFGAVRVLRRGQIALLVPFVETYRDDGGVRAFGGGMGDLNVSARYDFVSNGEYRWVPGMALLAGLSAPTGTPPESATSPLAVDATGVGAFQVQLGAAFEESFGPWLVTLSGIVAKRAARTAAGVRTELGTQWTALSSLAYVLPNGVAVAAFASYMVEGNNDIDGTERPNSARATPVLGVAAVFPVSDHFRLQGGLSANPPVSGAGQNNPTMAGATVTGIYSWF